MTATVSTDVALQRTCELFISSIYASQREDDYDCTAFATQANRTGTLNNTLAYIESKNAYQREISELCDFEIVSDHISFDNFSATVNGNTCTAEIGVHYTYELTGAFEDTCFVNCVYYLNLQKENGSWRIVSATTSMPDEQSDGFTYGAFDAHAAATAVKNDRSFTAVEKSVASTQEQTAEPDVLTVYKTTAYSSSAAISYAAKYYNKTNSLFGASDANCQNFASQCVWAGLLAGCNNAAGTSTTALPAVSMSYTGSNSKNVWCRNQYTTYYGDKYYLNWAWDNVNGFLKLILISDHSISGPQGYYWYGLANACAGDVISWDTAATRNVDNGDYEHSMFVTKANGTYGSRGVGDLFIAANTNPTTSAYQPLASYTSLSASYFATAHITGGYYKLPSTSTSYPTE